MAAVGDIFRFLERLAPVDMKMDFDNVGLLVGNSKNSVAKALLSLDITSAVISEAAEAGAGLIISHHPLFFSLKSVTDGDLTGKKVMRLLSLGIAAICMHTNFDAARGGTNDALAIAAGIADAAREAELFAVEGTGTDGTPYSYGRVGRLKEPVSMREYLPRLKKSLGALGLRYYDAGRDVCHIAVVGGSGGDYLGCAAELGCDTLLTADIKYNVFLDAAELGVNLIDGGHFCTENTAIPPLADKLRAAFPEAEFIVSSVHAQTAKFI